MHPTAASCSPSPAPVLPLRVGRDDAELVEGLRQGEAWARAALFDRYAPQMERTLRRILGEELHTDMADVLHDAFVQALASIDHVRDAAALPAWLHTVAAHTAFRTIRARRARRWLRFWEPALLPERAVDGVDPEALDAYARTYALLERMPPRERMAFALRYIEGMELQQVADACEMSLATVKRKLARAEERFVAAARRDPVLRTWLEEGARWNR